MKKSRYIQMALVALALMLGVGGCGSKQDKDTNKAVSLMNAYADRLSQIKTSGDVDAAKGDLQQIAQQFKDLQADMAQLPKPSDDDAKALEDKYGAQIQQAMQRVQSELGRIATSISPDAAAQVGQAMDFSNGMGAPGLGAP